MATAASRCRSVFWQPLAAAAPGAAPGAVAPAAAIMALDFPVVAPVEAIGHPHFEARDMVRLIDDPVLGEVMIPGYPFKFSAQPDLPDLVAPLLGEHNTTVLRDVLGYDDARISKLRDDGVLHEAQT